MSNDETRMIHHRPRIRHSGVDIPALALCANVLAVEFDFDQRRDSAE